MTAKEAVIQAAKQLSGVTGEEFALPDLVVVAWRLCPHSLGLKGYEDRFPDANKVSATLHTTNGLLYRPLIGTVLERVGPARYRVRTQEVNQ